MIAINCYRSNMPLIRQTDQGSFCNAEKCECEQIATDLIKFSERLAQMVQECKND